MSDKRNPDLSQLPGATRATLDEFLRLSSRSSGTPSAIIEELAQAVELKLSLAKAPRN
jgi:hypothetical protein